MVGTLAGVRTLERLCKVKITLSYPEYLERNTLYERDVFPRAHACRDWFTLQSPPLALISRFMAKALGDPLSGLLGWTPQNPVGWPGFQCINIGH